MTYIPQSNVDSYTVINDSFKYVPVRCPRCNKLLLYISTVFTGAIQPKCPRCNAIVRYPVYKAEVIAEPIPVDKRPESDELEDISKRHLTILSEGVINE